MLILLCSARAQAKIATKLFSTYRIRIATVFSYFYLFIFFFLILFVYSGFLVLSDFRLTWAKRDRIHSSYFHCFPFFRTRATPYVHIEFSLSGSTQTENGNGWRLRICEDAYYYFDAKEKKHSWIRLVHSLTLYFPHFRFLAHSPSLHLSFSPITVKSQSKRRQNAMEHSKCLVQWNDIIQTSPRC